MRRRTTELSLWWIVLTGGRSLPDIGPLILGYRLVTGQAFIPFPGRDSMIGFTVNMARIGFIVTVATGMRRRIMAKPERHLGHYTEDWRHRLLPPTIPSLTRRTLACRLRHGIIN